MGCRVGPYDTEEQALEYFMNIVKDGTPYGPFVQVTSVKAVDNLNPEDDFEPSVDMPRILN